MPVEIVHPLPAELRDPLYAAAMRAYLNEDRGAATAWRARAVDPDRAWAATDGGRVVGTLRTIADTLSVPAAPGAVSPRVDADLLSLVSVSPTHRRRGLLRQMITASLHQARERGEAVSVLVAAEYGIYGRFGYAPAAWQTTFEVHTHRAGARVGGDPVGSLREVDPVDVSGLGPAVYEAEMDHRAGLIGRDEIWWDRELRRLGPQREVVPAREHPTSPRHVVHLDDDGGVDGYVSWRVAAQDSGRRLGTLEVADLFAAGPVAYRELWRFLLGIDLVDEVHAPGRPVDDLLPWLLADARTAGATGTGDAMWLRILDVPAALSARGYPVDDELVIEVVDPAVGGWAAGRWRLSAGPDGATCVAAAEATPDLTLPQTTLASLYLGGVRAALLAQRGGTAAGGFDEHTPGAGARLDRLFATPLAPWRATDF